MSNRTATKLAFAVALSLTAYAAALRPRMLNYGATAAEISEPSPGAEIIPGSKRTGTMATTIDAPPAEVWPWLVQMGCDRAGWYSWDCLDNGGHPSSERIHPEWQRIAAGDRVYSLADRSTWFEVAAVEPRRFLALRAPLDLRGRPFDTDGPRPRFYSDSLWAFQLKELPVGRTRLLVGGYAATRPHALLALGNLLLWEPAHWVMQTRQWTNLKRRITGASDEDHSVHRELDETELEQVDS